MRACSPGLLHAASVHNTQYTWPSQSKPLRSCYASNRERHTQSQAQQVRPCVQLAALETHLVYYDFLTIKHQRDDECERDADAVHTETHNRPEAQASILEVVHVTLNLRVCIHRSSTIRIRRAIERLHRILHDLQPAYNTATQNTRTLACRCNHTKQSTANQQKQLSRFKNVKVKECFHSTTSTSQSKSHS
jgi:hypothetical protein